MAVGRTPALDQREPRQQGAGQRRARRDTRLLDRKGERHPRWRRSANEDMRRRGRDRPVAQPERQRRDGEQHDERRRRRGPGAHRRERHGAHQHAGLRYPDGAKTLDEAARGEAARHRADIDDADKDTNEVRGQLEIGCDHWGEHRGGGGGERSKHLESKRHRERGRGRGLAAARTPGGPRSASSDRPSPATRAAVTIVSEGVTIKSIVMSCGPRYALDDLHVEGADDPRRARCNKRQQAIVIAAAVAQGALPPRSNVTPGTSTQSIARGSTTPQWSNGSGIP